MVSILQKKLGFGSGSRQNHSFSVFLTHILRCTQDYLPFGPFRPDRCGVNISKSLMLCESPISLDQAEKSRIQISELSEASEDDSNDAAPDVVSEVSDVLDSKIEYCSCESSLSDGQRGTDL